jgi:sulfur-oxidizing protein SoxY
MGIADMISVASSRRTLLKAGGAFAALAAAGFVPRDALAAWNKTAFETKGVAESLRALGLAQPAASAQVQLVMSDVAENGAVVPVQIVSRAANTTKIGLMVERNPNTLSAVFEIGAGMLPEIATRVRLQETSNVVAFVVADGKVLTATRLVSVTLGGCAVSS